MVEISNRNRITTLVTVGLEEEVPLPDHRVYIRLFSPETFDKYEISLNKELYDKIMAAAIFVIAHRDNLRKVTFFVFKKARECV